MQAIVDWLKTDIIAGNSPLNIAALFLGLVVTLVLAKVIQSLLKGRLKRLSESTETQLDDVALVTLEKPLYWILLVAGIGISFRFLVLPEMGSTAVGNATTLFFIVFIAWSLTNLLTAMRSTYLDPLIDASESKLDDQIVPIVERSLKIVIWSMAILLIFSNMGYDIISLIAGLGIGGLALALAAQDMLSNIFGSVTIFADRPFQVDDVVTVAGHTGTMEDVGLRTCRMKTFDGTLVTVPNKALVGGPIENLSYRTARKFSGTIGLVYETTSDDLDRAMDTIKEILEANELVREDFSVRFSNFGDSALELSVLYWVVPPSEYFDVVSEVNRAIKRAFDKAGFDMAFPSMTIYKAG
jgi:MscS family membrane protein